ncbi:MAG: fibrobacter succinogenes major paralogous domain-containing protein [Candidatus Kapaibacteriota bacterium]
MIHVITLTLFSMLLLSSCSEDATTPIVDTTPKDTIQTIAIGTQVWMTKNLDIAKFRNGDIIPEAKTDSAWIAAAMANKPAWCFYEYSDTNGKKYGKLYNWYAVSDVRGLAPQGFHVPTDVEWTRLTNQLKGDMVAGSKLKSKADWLNSGNGNDTTGFTALPGGYCSENGFFYSLGELGSWWSATQENTTNAFSREMNNENSVVKRYNASKSEGLSVRCVKD